MCPSPPDPQPPGDPVGDGPDADAEEVARKILLRQLSDRPRTRAELATALHRKGVPTDMATTLLDRFEEVGLIDDQEFARSWVQSRLTGRGLARRSLGAELRRKGVDAETVRTALDDLDPDQEEAVARQLVRRKARPMQGLDPTVRMRRLTSMLARKGYSPGMAFRVVREEQARDEDPEVDGLAGDDLTVET